MFSVDPFQYYTHGCCCKSFPSPTRGRIPLWVGEDHGRGKQCKHRASNSRRRCAGIHSVPDGLARRIQHGHACRSPECFHSFGIFLHPIAPSLPSGGGCVLLYRARAHIQGHAQKLLSHLFFVRGFFRPCGWCLLLRAL
jgi:hypothetical protein